MKVLDPQGQTWRIGRRWLPWRLRPRDMSDLSSGFSLGDDLIGTLVGIVLVVVVLPILLLVVVFALEFALLLLLLPIVVLIRVAFGRHWKVVVRRGLRFDSETDGGDWSASRERIFALAKAIESGGPPVSS